MLRWPLSGRFARLLQHASGMFFTDIAVVLAVILFIAAVAIELRRDRDKKMYVGGEAKTQAKHEVSSNMPVVQSQASPPVVTQEEFKRPTKSA
jgi:hypothetical protein